MTEDDDFVRTWWITNATPYVDRVVPADEIARINGTFVWPMPPKPKRKDHGLTWCRECSAVLEQGDTERTYCRKLCKVKALARKRAARKGCT